MGSGSCIGSSPPFEVVAGETVAVSLTLQCDSPVAAGSVNVSAELNACPTAPSIVASPVSALVQTGRQRERSSARRGSRRVHVDHTLAEPGAELNKAYQLIVREQSFLKGRDATVTSPANVYRQIEEKEVPPLAPEHRYAWDIRLAWPANSRVKARGSARAP